MSTMKIRLTLSAFIVGAVAVIFSFLWAINLNEPEALRATINHDLLILAAFTTAVLVSFFMKADLYDITGKLDRSKILIMTTTVLIVAQLSIAFANYAYREIEFIQKTKAESLAIYEQLLQDEVITDTGIAHVNLFAYIEDCPRLSALVITSADGTVLRASPSYQNAQTIDISPLNFYTFPINNIFVNMEISASYSKFLIQNIILKLISTLAVALFLTIEIMMFAMKYLDRKTDTPQLINGKLPCTALVYVRQIAFVFYFASKLPSSFIAVLAKDLGGDFMGLDANVLASIPMSVEAFFTCGAIFVTATLIETRGFKVPFLAGLAMVTGGTLLSAFSTNIGMYIVARGLVGLGYGFVWMTLRNLSLFGRDSQERNAGFALLNAGLYAGVNCGAVLGSVLAETFGYAPVLTLAAVLTLMCSIVLLRMENASYKRPAPAELACEKLSPNVRQALLIALFVLLMIVPTVIAGSFLSYYLPLHFMDTGYSISDVSRAQLLYGLLIIYVGPKFAKIQNLRNWTWAYSLLIALAFIFFGLTGGILAAFAAVLLLGTADSFGFVVQNNYFLKFRFFRTIGESQSLSILSFLKKIAEMFGPIAFALFMTNGLAGIATMGAAFLLCTIVYILFIDDHIRV